MSGGEILVHVAEYKVGGAGDVLLTIGLGSCVAVALHDPKVRVGGLAHILLPSPALSRRDQSPGKFPQTAIPLLMQDMVARGAVASRITARIAGGASIRRERSRWASATWSRCARRSPTTPSRWWGARWAGTSGGRCASSWRMGGWKCPRSARE